MTERQWDSLSSGFRSEVRRLTSPQLEKRKAARLELQRRGYVNTLAGVISADGLDALLAFVRSRLQLEFSLPHEPIAMEFPLVGPDDIPRNARGFVSLGQGTFSITLADDWTFPVDPWEKRTP